MSNRFEKTEKLNYLCESEFRLCTNKIKDREMPSLLARKIRRAKEQPFACSDQPALYRIERVPPPKSAPAERAHSASERTCRDFRRSRRKTEV